MTAGRPAIREQFYHYLLEQADFPVAGCYQLVLRLAADISLPVGRRGDYLFPAGVHIYTGSHQKSLRKRLLRHLRLEKTRHWHIDYLTSQPAVIWQDILVFPDSRRECELNRGLAEFLNARFLIPNFGNGDCRSACPGHLIYRPAVAESELAGWQALNPGSFRLRRLIPAGLRARGGNIREG